MAFAAFGGGAAREPAPLKKGRVAIALLAPGIAYLVLFYLTPLISLVMTSFQTIDPELFEIGRYVQALRWENYVDAMGQYWPQFLRSFVYALIATVVALLISYPIAYFIGVTARPWPFIQALALVLVIAPFFISFLLRTLAWKQFFGDNAFIATTLHAWGILPPDQNIVGTPFAVVFGLVYNFIPFMTLPIYASLERLDTRYLEAGSDLYATPSTVFWRVTLPLSLPGVVSGTLLTFIPIAGDYINAAPEYLGGPDTTMIGNVIEYSFLRLQTYPIAASLSVCLMAVILVFVSVYVRRTGTEDLL